MSYKRMTDEEKAQGLADILGKEDADKLTFSDSANREPSPSFYEVEDEDEEHEEGETAEEEVKEHARRQEADDEPAWVKAMNRRNDDLQAEVRAQRSELATLRQYQAQERQQYQQPRQQEPAQEEQDFWATGSDIKQAEQRIRQEYQQTQEAVYRMSLNQEWNNFQQSVMRLQHEMREAGNPEMSEVLPGQNLKATFDAFARNPNAFGGFNQNWYDHLKSAYRNSAFDALAKKSKEAQAKADEVAKKRTEKATQTSNNLRKIAKSGSPVQEPQKKQWSRERRSYKSSFVRNAALKILEGE